MVLLNNTLWEAMATPLEPEDLVLFVPIAVRGHKRCHEVAFRSPDIYTGLRQLGSAPIFLRECDEESRNGRSRTGEVKGKCYEHMYRLNYWHMTT